MSTPKKMPTIPYEPDDHEPDVVEEMEQALDRVTRDLQEET